MSSIIVKPGVYYHVLCHRPRALSINPPTLMFLRKACAIHKHQDTRMRYGIFMGDNRKTMRLW